MPSRSPDSLAISGLTRIAPTESRSIDRRVYQPAAPELDGHVLNVGFGVAVNATPFENLASQVALGGKARVAITARRNLRPNTPEWERDFLIVEEHLPAGTTLIEGSVKTTAASYELADGLLTFLLRARPGSPCHLVRCLRIPAGPVSGFADQRAQRLRAGPIPSRARRAICGSGRRASPAPIPIKPTPDELYARGKIDFDAGRFTEAGEALEPLFAGYTLREDIAKDAARMLLLTNIRADQPRKIVTVLRGRQGESPRAHTDLRPVAGDRQSVSRDQRIRAGNDCLARPDRSQLSGRRPRGRAVAAARQDPRGDRLPDRALADVSEHGVDRERLLRSLAGVGSNGVAGVGKRRPPP